MCCHFHHPLSFLPSTWTPHHPNVLATEPPRTTDNASINKALSMIGNILLSYGPSILFLRPKRQHVRLSSVEQLGVSYQHGDPVDACASQYPTPPGVHSRQSVAAACTRRYMCTAICILATLDLHHINAKMSRKYAMEQEACQACGRGLDCWQLETMHASQHAAERRRYMAYVSLIKPIKNWCTSSTY